MRVVCFFLIGWLLPFVQVLAQSASVVIPSGTVVIPEKTFNIPELNRSRQLRIYLPPGYAESQESYAVLYMHDAQNLFDAATAYAGEWRVDENLDELVEEIGLKLIVVGIDNGREHRNTELSPWLNENIGGAEGEAYMSFLVQVVKPYIDKNYRTKSDLEHTAIMGSSLGGLISHYAVYQYPEVFSKAGIFSPSYWVSNKVFDFTKARPLSDKHRLYLLMGGKEGATMNRFFKKMHHQIRQSNVDMVVKVNPDGEHNEQFWDLEFKAAIKWLFKN